MKRALIYTTTAAFVLLIATSMAMAGEVVGENIAMPKPDVATELPNGTTYLAIGNSQVCRTTDSSHPLNNAAGDCGGGCIVDAEGNATCMGSCTWVDNDGDLALFTWDGQTSGSWKLVGGSGKYAYASGKGTWEGTGAYPGGIVKNSWRGEIDIK